MPDCLLTRRGLHGLFALSTDNPRVSVIEEVQIPQKQTHRWHWKGTAYQCRLPSALGRAPLSQKGSLTPLSPRTGMRETCNTQRHCTKHSPAHTENHKYTALHHILFEWSRSGVSPEPRGDASLCGVKSLADAVTRPCRLKLKING